MIPTPLQVAEYERRKAIVRQALVLRESKSLPKTAKALKMPLSTLNRYLRDHREGGEVALMPDVSTGRPAVAACLDDGAISRLRRQRMKCGSTALTLQHFADDPLCPDELAEFIKTMKNPHSIPLSLRRAINVTPEMEAKYRGPVHYGHVAFKCRHSDQLIDPVTNEPRDVMAGDMYVSDDMSRNQYFWFELDDKDIETRSNRGDKLAKKFGVALGRQCLWTMDYRGKWLGVSGIGCARDAYTSADVLRHVKNILSQYGKPRLAWIFEKGVWAARTVDGQKIWIPEEERFATRAGLKSLGFEVDHVHTSEGKATIEGGFNHLQKAQSLQEDAPDIGRVRGEMEHATKLIARIQAGVVHPAAEGVESLAEAVQNDFKTAVWLNGLPKFGRIQNGIPDQEWFRDVTKSPLRPLTSEEMGTFMPIKIETHIRQGCVEKKIDGRCYRFTCPELFAEIGAGYRMLVCFDDSDPAAGADLYNLETGSRNIKGWRHMEHIGRAEWEKERPLFGYSDEVGESTDRRKRYARAFKTSYAGTGIFGKHAMAVAENRDGEANVTRIARGVPAVSSPAAAPEAEPAEAFPTAAEIMAKRSRGVSVGSEPLPAIMSRMQLAAS